MRVRHDRLEVTRDAFAAPAAGVRGARRPGEVGSYPQIVSILTLLWLRREAGQSGETVFHPKQQKTVPRVPPLPARNAIVVFDDGGEMIGTVEPE